MAKNERASGLFYWLGWLFLGTQQGAYEFKDFFTKKVPKVEYKLSEVLHKDADEILEWAQSLTGKEENFAALIRELISVFSDGRSYIDDRLNAVYVIQCIGPVAWRMKVNFNLAKELIGALMGLVWSDIHQRVGELAQRAIPVLMNVTDAFLQQKRLQ